MKRFPALSLAWIALVGGTALAFYAVVFPQFRAAALLVTSAHDAYTQTNLNEARLRDAGRIEESQRRVTAQFAMMRLPNERSRGVAGALRAIAALEGEFGVDVVRFAPEEAPGSTSERRLTIQLRGQYRDVLPAVAAISKGPALLRVVGMQVERTNAMSKSVDAVVHVTVYDGLGML